MQNHAMIQAGKRFLVVILDISSHSQTRADFKVRLNFKALSLCPYPVKYWLSLKMERLQPLCETS